MISRIKNTIFTVGLTVTGLLLAGSVSAATFVASPTSGSFTVGQSITVTVKLNSAGQAINAGEATVTWTPATLQFVSVSSSSSIFKYWPIDPVVRGTATVVFSGGLPSPGFNGSAGTVVRLSFRAKATGTATVNISGARILANDGFGTDLYTGQSAATYTIKAGATSAPTTSDVPNRPTPAVSSTSHPDQSTWYTLAEAKLAWTKPNGLQGVSFALTDNAATVPDEAVETSGTATTVTLPKDGTWFFHLRGKYDSGWSATSHFALHLDRTAPEAFTPVIVQDRGATDPTPVLTFTTTDSVSGIAKYLVSIDGDAGVEATSPTDLSGIKAGAHTVTVVAYDQAGNTTTGTASLVVEGYPAPTITFVSTPLLLLDPLVVRGTANIGDTITIYVNNQMIGHAVAGPGDASAAPGVTLRVPWTFTADTLFRPGAFTVTATATSTDGRTSVTTDPRQVRVNGQALTLNGRPIATLSVVTPIIVLVILLLVLISGVMTRLIISIVILHRREEVAEEELETLRDINQRQTIGRQQLDSALLQIEEDLEEGPTPRPVPSRRRPKKRPR